MSVVSVQEIEDYVDAKISAAGILMEKRAPPTISAQILDGSQSTTTTIENEAVPLNEPEKVHIHHQPTHHIQFDLESTNSHQFLYEQLNSNRNRLNSSRMKRAQSDEQPLYLTHITLSLNHLGNQSANGNSRLPAESCNWKYNTIRKNPFPNAYFSRADAALRRSV